MWDGLPGSVYDLIAARDHGILDSCRDANPVLLADCGYIGACEGTITPYRFWKKELGPSYKAANNAHAKPPDHDLLCSDEHGISPGFGCWNSSFNTHIRDRSRNSRLSTTRRPSA